MIMMIANNSFMDSLFKACITYCGYCKPSAQFDVHPALSSTTALSNWRPAALLCKWYEAVAARSKYSWTALIYDNACSLFTQKLSINSWNPSWEKT